VLVVLSLQSYKVSLVCFYPRFNRVWLFSGVLGKAPYKQFKNVPYGRMKAGGNDGWKNTNGEKRIA
jgi:hypothetical protein